MKRLFVIVLVIYLLTGCSFRGFSPPSEPYNEFAIKDKEHNVAEVKEAMIECGYLPEWGLVENQSLTMF